MIIEAIGDWFKVITWFEHAPSQPNWNIKGGYHNFMHWWKQAMIISKHIMQSQIFKTSHATAITTKLIIKITSNMKLWYKSQFRQLPFCITNNGLFTRIKHKSTYLKPERVSLPHKDDMIQLYDTENKTKENRKQKQRSSKNST